MCDKCSTEFSVSHGGKNNITKHLATMKHRRFWIMSLPRLKWNSFFAVLAVCNTEKQLALAEELFAFHTIKHSQSFRWFVRRKWSKHCTTKKLHVQGQKAKQLFVMFFHHVRFRNCRKNWIHAHLYPYILMLPTTKIFGYRIQILDCSFTRHRHAIHNRAEYKILYIHTKNKKNKQIQLKQNKKFT